MTDTVSGSKAGIVLFVLVQHVHAILLQRVRPVAVLPCEV